MSDPTPSVKAGRARSADDGETWRDDGPAPTLDAFDNATELRATALSVEQNQRVELRTSDVVGALLATQGGKPGQGYPAVLGSFDSTSSGAYPMLPDDGPSPPVKVGSGINVSLPPAVATTMQVRRLTPLECERLMGWPDDHTRWRADGTEQADTARYRQVGNGVAAPVAHWLGDQIMRAAG